MKTLSLPLTLLLAALTLPSVASAATTIGQVRPDGATALACNANSAYAPNKTTPDVSYVVPPGGGVITQWSTVGAGGAATLSLEVFQPSAINLEYTTLAESKQEPIAANVLNTFNTQIPVAAGQVIGLHAVTAQSCNFMADAGNQVDTYSPAPAVGATQLFSAGLVNTRANVQAVVEPDTDGDGFGDDTQDAGPQASVDKGPKKQSRSPKATFRFSANENGATFQCRLDKKGFSACTSPHKVKKLKKRRHKFLVRALDSAGNEGPAATFRWRVK